MRFYIIIILFTLALTNNDFINTQVLFDTGEYNEARDMFETISEKNEDIFYLGYQIYYKLEYVFYFLHMNSLCKIPCN